MCGIFGTYNYGTNRKIDIKLVKESTNLLHHRGPDGEGFYFDEENGIALGHRRLSIIDLQTGDQPMTNEDKSIWLVFNGEIYNYKELRIELIKKGHKFKTESDTEVIVHLYEEYGVNCPQKLNGIFAFAIWDSKKKEVFLARDHFGVKPLYYYVAKNFLVFASELKSILKYVDSIDKNIDLQALYYCLLFRNIPTSSTLFSEIKKLPPAHYLVIDNKGSNSPKTFWNKLINIDSSKNEKEWAEIINESFKTAVKRQMMADVPIGISLSGGIDSSAILSMMSKYSTGKVHAFTVGFEDVDQKDNEIERAKNNAKLFNAEFTSEVISVSDYLEFMDRYLWHLEEPIGNESALAYYFVARLAKGKVKVLLNGQGSDEIFAGYDRNIGIHYSLKYKSIARYVSKTIEALPFIISPTRKHQLNRYKDFLRQQNDVAKIAAAASIISFHERKRIFDSNMSMFVDQKIERKPIEYITENNTISGNFLEKMLLFDMFSSLSENLLLSEDKMSMAAGIEARVPFLDIDLVEKALTIPTNLKIRNGSGKYIFKKACESILPKSIVYQKKIGFKSPVDKWLKKSLGEQFRDLMNSQNSITSTYLNKNEVTKMFDEHQKGKVNHQRFLHTLYTIEKWASIFMNIHSSI